MIEVFLIAVGALLALRWFMQLALERLNQRAVQQAAGAVPPAFGAIMDLPTYQRATAYSLAKSRLYETEATLNLLLLVVLLFTGLLPVLHAPFARTLGTGTAATAAFVSLVILLVFAAGLPLSWYAQFHVEQKFGFNTTSPALWRLDQLKAALLALAIGYPLLCLILALVNAGTFWWFWAWLAVLAVQLLLVFVAPILVLPLFNRFTPLPGGSLRDRLLALAARARFQAAAVQVMDSSKRSRHANAFFTGLGRFRKIVLFDTLLAQLTEAEIEAVLAHEIGHFRRKHIPKMFLASSGLALLGFFGAAWFIRQPWFYQALGFAEPVAGIGLLVLALLAGPVSFWTLPLLHHWSRRFEYEADAFAAQTIGAAAPLVAALRKLSEKNLANLTPHPWYSTFYYSHPTLLERERGLVAAAASPNFSG